MSDSTRLRWPMFLVSNIFGLFQFFLQMSSGIMIPQLMDGLPTNALGVSLISSSFYLIYFIMQLPAGMLLDRFGTRRLLTGSAIACGLGCWLFSMSHSLGFAIAGRILTGAGASFAFIGEVKVMMNWFPSRWFGTLLGLAESIAMIGIMAGNVLLAHLLGNTSWRTAMFTAGAFSYVIGLLCWLCMRDPDQRLHQPWRHFFQDVRYIIQRRAFWCNGLYCSINFSVITVFAAFWESPYLIANHFSATLSALICSMMFVGIAIAGPATGWVYVFIKDKSRYLSITALITCFLVIWMIYYTPKSLPANLLIMLLMGITSSCYVFNFSLARDYAPQHAKGTGIAFANALCIIATPLLQPFIGWLMDFSLDYTQATHHMYSVTRYHLALSIIPILLVVSSIIAYGLPKNHRD